MSENRSIFIAGGGIAGLACALSCAANGFRVELFEAAKEADFVGAGIQIGPNAYRILEKLKVAKTLANAASIPLGIDLRSGYTGDVINSVNLGEDFASRYGAPYLALHRADLHQVLLAECNNQQDIHIHHGAKVDDFSSHRNGVSISTTIGNNVETRSGKFLVIADGVKSKLRDSFLHPFVINGPAIHTGFQAWRAMLPSHFVPEFLDLNYVHLCMAHNNHAVLYPVNQKRYLNMVFVEKTDDLEKTNPYKKDISVLRQSLLSNGKSSWSKEFGQLLSDEVDWSVWPILEAPTANHWGHKNALAIGDAAHGIAPFAAQGASMAIEDAYTFGELLGKFGDDIDDVQNKFHIARAGRINKMRRTANSNVDLYHMGRTTGKIRDFVLKNTPQSMLRHKTNWIYNWELIL